MSGERFRRIKMIDKNSAGVAPEVNMRNPLLEATVATVAWKSKTDVTRIQKKGIQRTLKKDLYKCPPKNFKKKEIKNH